jgi:hypothetical protein
MNKTDEALSKILSTLADKFGTTLDNLYAIMIKKAFITGIECCMGIIFASIIYILFIKYSIKCLCRKIYI